MIKNLIARITRQAETTELARLSPASELARQLRECVIVPMTGDEFKSYIRERATGPALYRASQER